MVDSKLSSDSMLTDGRSQGADHTWLSIGCRNEPQDRTPGARFSRQPETPGTIKWDALTVRFPIASVRRLALQGNKVLFQNTRESKKLMVRGRSCLYSKLMCAIGKVWRCELRIKCRAAADHPGGADAGRSQRVKGQGST